LAKHIATACNKGCLQFYTYYQGVYSFEPLESITSSIMKIRIAVIADPVFNPYDLMVVARFSK
jgi:hypothetical protein